MNNREFSTKWFIENTGVQKQIKNIDPLVLKILKKRGLTEKEQLKKYFKGTIGDLYDPYLFNGMKKAVELITEAVRARRKIIVYGDYDVDGITASSLLLKYFADELDYKIDYYLPNRLKEGYGLNLEAAKDICTAYDLMITVDCGITAVREIEYVTKRGLQVIITDHHQPAEELPPAEVILDPHLQDCGYPYPYLAGVGVAFKLCQALGANIDSYLELVALGSIADIVPLTDENRLLVKRGLKLLNNTTSPGLKELVAQLGLTDRDINAGQVGYILAPPLNAAGRIKDPAQALKLLITDSQSQAEKLAAELIATNRERQQKEELIYQEALEMIERFNSGNQRCLVLSSLDWHPGVIGIVASRLVERFNLPVIMIAEEDNLGRGSCRSISGINIFRALQECSKLLENYGGHALAAGLTISRDNIRSFRKKLNRYLCENFSEQDFIPGLQLDEVISPGRITRQLYTDLEKMKPFGAGNPRPRFLLNNTEIANCYQVGKDKSHLKLKLKQGTEAIGFGLGREKQNIEGNRVNLACAIRENEWQGQKKLELDIKDINIREDCSYYPICFKNDNWMIYDKRGCSDRREYIQQLLINRKRIAVYLNSRKKRQIIREELQTGDSELKLFSASSGLDGIKARELILYSLPFTLNDLQQMVSILTGDEIKHLHLLYGRKDYYQCRQAIQKRLQELDFEQSIRYNKLKNIKDEFNHWAQLAYRDNLFELINKLEAGKG